MKSDAFHVMPTDGKVNGQRSNLPYGECSKGESAGSKALGRKGKSSFSGYSGDVFEPDDEFKGDLARNYFYMITCYRTASFTQSKDAKVMFTTSNGHAAFTTYGINLLLKWHRQDPVSQKEIDRNNAVYKHQKNRNPYIDYPCLVEYIWGSKSTLMLDLSQIMSSDNEKFLTKEYNSGCQCDDPSGLNDILAPGYDSDNTQSSTLNPQPKVMINGHLYIRYGNQMYNAQGQVIR